MAKSKLFAIVTVSAIVYGSIAGGAEAYTQRTIDPASSAPFYQSTALATYPAEMSAGIRYAANIDKAPIENDQSAQTQE